MLFLTCMCVSSCKKYPCKTSFFVSIKWPIAIFTLQQSILFMYLELQALEINSIPFKATRQQNWFHFCNCNLRAHKLYIHSYVVLILSGNYRLSLCAVTLPRVLALEWGGDEARGLLYRSRSHLWRSAKFSYFSVPIYDRLTKYWVLCSVEFSRAWEKTILSKQLGPQPRFKLDTPEMTWCLPPKWVHIRDPLLPTQLSPFTSPHTDGRSYFR